MRRFFPSHRKRLSSYHILSKATGRHLTWHRSSQFCNIMIKTRHIIEQGTKQTSVAKRLTIGGADHVTTITDEIGVFVVTWLSRTLPFLSQGYCRSHKGDLMISTQVPPVGLARNIFLKLFSAKISWMLWRLVTSVGW